MTNEQQILNIPVMILCGGLGTRLHEATEVRPKPMVEIGGRPILWHLMKYYASYGLDEFILCLGYKGSVIKDYFLNYKSLNSDITLQLNQPDKVQYHGSNSEENWRVTLVETGDRAQTGARVARAAHYVDNDIFCLTYGDGLADIDIQALLRFHLSHGRVGTVTGVHPPGRFGEISLGTKGQVQQFNEKPQVTGGIINGGFFVFNRSFFEKYLDVRDELVLEQDPLKQLAKDGELMVYLHTGFWQPMDRKRDLDYLQELWESGEAPWQV